MICEGFPLKKGEARSIWPDLIVRSRKSGPRQAQAVVRAKASPPARPLGGRFGGGGLISLSTPKRVASEKALKKNIPVRKEWHLLGTLVAAGAK